MSATFSGQENTSAAILSRIFDVPEKSIPAEAAHSYLALKFKKTDVQRMNRLAAKARKGTLTEQERQEAEQYNLIGHLLSLLKARAHRILKNKTNGTVMP